MQYLKVLQKNKFILIVFAIGLFLRVYKLDQIPKGFYVDEAEIGYTAYSFLKTGFRDEYGKFLPIFLRSFSAYSSPLYSYIDVFFIWIFGLNVFAVRILSALSGAISIPLIYILTNKLFKNSSLSKISSLIFAISPWSIFFSRGTYEANLSVMILLFSLVLLVESTKSINYLYLASIILATNTYAYQSQRIISILLLVLFSLLNLKIKNIKKIFAANIIFLLLLLPQIIISLSPAFSSRAAGLFYADRATNIILFFREFFSQYFNYFSINNLFLRGDPDLQRSIPELAPFYSFLYLPFVLGIFEIFKNLKEKEYLVIFILLVIFPIVPALTKDPFSTIRNLSSIIPIIIIISLGIFKIYKNINKKLFIMLATICLISAFIYLWRSYFVLFPYERAKVWNDGYENLSEIVRDNPNEKFVVENNRLKPPYILLAFYLKLDPKELQNSADPDIKNNYYENTEWNPNYKLANFETRNINWEKDIYNNLILVGDELSISEGQAKEHFLEKVFEIKTRSGEIVFVGYKTNPEEKCKSHKEVNEKCK